MNRSIVLLVVISLSTLNQAAAQSLDELFGHSPDFSELKRYVDALKEEKDVNKQAVSPSVYKGVGKDIASNTPKTQSDAAAAEVAARAANGVDDCDTAAWVLLDYLAKDLSQDERDALRWSNGDGVSQQKLTKFMRIYPDYEKFCFEHSTSIPHWIGVLSFGDKRDPICTISDLGEGLFLSARHCLAKGTGEYTVSFSDEPNFFIGVETLNTDFDYYFPPEVAPLEHDYQIFIAYNASRDAIHFNSQRQSIAAPVADRLRFVGLSRLSLTFMRLSGKNPSGLDAVRTSIEDACWILPIQEHRLFHGCQTEEGGSGAPLVQNDKIVGIHLGAAKSDGANRFVDGWGNVGFTLPKEVIDGKVWELVKQKHR